MLGIAGMLRCGAASPRFAYLPIDPRLPGARRIRRRARRAAPGRAGRPDRRRVVQCYRLDYGPGGMFTFMRDADLRRARPARAAQEQAAPDLETVREVLKNFRVPRELARSPLARGATVAERAESVQQLIRQAADEAFGDSESEKLLLQRAGRRLPGADAQPRGGGEQAAAEPGCLLPAAADRGRAAGRAHGRHAAATASKPSERRQRPGADRTGRRRAA